jgi:hypothetical protein
LKFKSQISDSLSLCDYPEEDCERVPQDDEVRHIPEAACLIELAGFKEVTLVHSVNKLSPARGICKRRFFAVLSSFLPAKSALKSKLLYVIELDTGKDDCSRAALSAGYELCGFFAEADSSLFIDT